MIRIFYSTECFVQMTRRMSFSILSGLVICAKEFCIIFDSLKALMSEDFPLPQVSRLISGAQPPDTRQVGIAKSYNLRTM